MPNRMLRAGIITSEAVNKLSPQAELFYRRMMSIVDDFGRFDGRPAIIRPMAYPLQLDRVGEASVKAWIKECEKQELLVIYWIDGKPYLQMLKWDQPRAKASKWPAPPPDVMARAYTCSHVQARVSTNMHMRPDTDTDTESNKGIVRQPPPDAPIVDILSYLNAQTGRDFKPVEANLRFIRARMGEGFDSRALKAVIDDRVAEWGKDPKMAQYLRPETLFNATKFHAYVNGLKKPKEPGAAVDPVDRLKRAFAESERRRHESTQN